MVKYAKGSSLIELFGCDFSGNGWDCGKYGKGKI